MKGYTPITNLKDFVNIFSCYKSDSEIAYLFNVTEKDIKLVREGSKKKSNSKKLKV